MNILTINEAAKKYRTTEYVIRKLRKSNMLNITNEDMLIDDINLRLAITHNEKLIRKQISRYPEGCFDPRIDNGTLCYFNKHTQRDASAASDVYVFLGHGKSKRGKSS